jgi:hypothetical protein
VEFDFGYLGIFFLLMIDDWLQIISYLVSCCLIAIQFHSKFIEKLLMVGYGSSTD